MRVIGGTAGGKKTFSFQFWYERSIRAVFLNKHSFKDGKQHNNIT